MAAHPYSPGKAVNRDLASGSFASSQTLAILREFGETSLDFEVLGYVVKALELSIQ